MQLQAGLLGGPLDGGGQHQVPGELARLWAWGTDDRLIHSDMQSAQQEGGEKGKRKNRGREVGRLGVGDSCCFK